jgi:hypothetical protein
MFTILALFLTIAAFSALAYFFGADSRDGRDWATSERDQPPEEPEEIRTIGSREPEVADRVAADPRPTVRAA